ncbi:hypothetical protein, partial [Rhodococcus sp. (in: high G+C Gram-positive bacteria)]|uniref:hypothetical protein n=1 Tax=Rhodococcus sp. TaxID=1831 RepID=UPI003BB5FDA2
PDGPRASRERAELERLRAEVATLRTRVAEVPPEPAPAERKPRHALRWTAVVILVVLVALLSIATVSARFVRGEILDTDRYVTTVTPLASDPAIQDQIAATVTDEIFTRLDVEQLTANALSALTDVVPATENAPRLDNAIEGLAPVIAGQARSFVNETVLSLVRSDQFDDLWIQANRAAHTGLVAVMTGEAGPSSVSVDDSGTVSISLGTVIDNVKARLIDRGFTFAEKIPAIDKQFVLFQSPDLVRAQRAVSALDKASGILPWVTIAAAVAAVVVAPAGRRLRALAFVGVALAVGMLILAIALIVGRALYLDQIPPDVLSPDAASALIDTVLVPLRAALRGVAVLGLVIAVVAYLTGGSASASAVRRGFGRGLDTVQRARRTRPPNEVELWVARARVPLRVAIVAIGAVMLMFWRYPTGMVVVWIVIGVLLALLVLEMFVRPVRTWHAQSGGDAAPPPNADDLDTDLDADAGTPTG